MKIHIGKKELNIPWEYFAAPFLIILASIIVIAWRIDSRQEETIPVSVSPFVSGSPANTGTSADPQDYYDVPDPDDNPADSAGATGKPGDASQPVNSEAPVMKKVSINKAGMDELISLPYIGEVKAGAIIAYRTANGPFKTVDDLLNVKGIGPKTLERLKPLITLD